MAQGGNDRSTTVTALVYAFYGLLVLVLVLAALWLFGVVPGWLVPAALALTLVAFAALWRALARLRQTSSSSRPSEGPPA